MQFKVTASVAGTYSGAIQSAADTRSYPFTYTVPANTDTLIQIPNIPGDTGGSWVGATNASAAIINFDMGTGTTYKSTANSWQASNFIGVTGTTNLVSQVNGSTLTITDVQFEVGSVCTQFERKLYGQNLMECQRYLRPLNTYGASGQCVGTVNSVNISIGVPMRALPSFTTVSTINVTSNTGAGIATTNLVVNGSEPDGSVLFTTTVAGGLTAGNASYVTSGLGFFGAQI